MDYKGAKVQGAVSTAIRKLLELLQDLIYKRDFQEAALVFCALALHYRSIPEVIWKGGIEILRNQSDAVLEQGVLFYRQVTSMTNRNKDRALLELALYHLQFGNYSEAEITLSGLKKIKSALLNMGVIQGYLGFSSLGLLFKLFVEEDESIAAVIKRIDFNSIRKKIQKFKEDNEPVLIGERMRSAREALDQASRLSPSCDVYRFWLATLAVMAGNLDIARVAFESFLENNPSHPNALRLLAHLYLMPPPVPMPVLEAPAPTHAKRQRGGRVGLSKVSIPEKPVAAPAATTSTKSKKVSKEDKLKAVEIYKQLLRVDPTHNEAFKCLCAAYKQELITSAAMTEVVALRLDFFPDSAALWKFLAVLVQRVLKQRVNVSPEEATTIENHLAGWRKLVHWWKRNLFSLDGLNEMLNRERHSVVVKENFSLWLWRGICCAILLSRVPFLKTLAYSRLVQENPELDQQVREAVQQFELEAWIYPETEEPEQDRMAREDG
eukprot:TRINITY_DN2956_c0_g1_i2.p1 TRINITY_DN2956_c0_g1~~TRINITY_DN2956_c0_g1_i2.p1  ORF type:complete len:494 (+),score=54.63 TRINITY_DN2956_c0_g1_i2:151-1632(+)